MNPKNGHVAFTNNDGQLFLRAGSKTLHQSILSEIKLSNEWIETISFSPYGSYLAVGSHDNTIYILDVNDSYKVKSKCQKHNSFITSLDWSADGKFIQSNCGAYELLFHSAESGEQQTGGATKFRDEKWATFSCKLGIYINLFITRKTISLYFIVGWPVQGIFPPNTDGSHVNGVDRSQNQQLFAVGDDWGFVNLYNNPNDKESKANSYRAHSSHVVRVKFDASDKYVYSVGGYDRTLMKWRIV